MQESVKLFVSSTFEDMHAERDHLNRFVFPRVRERCRAVGVDFVAVDLRWGVTREEAQSQDVAELCVREVDRCRPFFLALIGDRYGWVPAPDRVPLAFYERVRGTASSDDAALLDHSYRLDETAGAPVMRVVPGAVAGDAERLAIVRIWERAGLPGAGKSLTEIEIQHALAARRGSGRAGSKPLVYLRDPPVHVHPAFPEPFVRTFSSADEGSRRRLDDLKRRLTAGDGSAVVRRYATNYAGLKIEAVYVPAGLSSRERRVLDDGVVRPDEWEGLTKRLRTAVARRGRVALDGLEEWGTQVGDDLWSSIESEVGERPRPGGAPAPAGLDRDHETFLTECTRLFVGRDDLLTQALAFAAGDDVDRTLVVTGRAGSGKSAFLAECTARYRNRDPAAVVLPHFVGVGPGTTDVRITVRSLCERLRHACQLGDPIPESPEELEFALSSFLERAAARHRVVVLIDAVNQLDPARGAQELRWLPRRLPLGVRVVVSTLPGLCLDRLRQRVPLHRVMDLPELAADHRRELVRRVLAVRGKRLAQEQFERLLNPEARPDAVLPLYLLVALEELSTFGDFEGLNQRIGALPARVPDLFDQVLARLELDHGRLVTERVLTWLAVSRSGLLESEIRDLLATGHPALPPLAWSRLRLALDFYLRRVDERREGLTGFYHDQLQVAVYRRYLDMASPDDPPSDGCVARHQELASYFRSEASTPDGWDAAATRALAELPFHQVRGGQAADLGETLSDWRFLDAKVRAQPTAMVLADFDLLLEDRRAGAPALDAVGLRWIRDALRLAGPVVAQDPEQLPSQLWARLLPRSSPALRALRTGLAQEVNRPWLRPYATGLTAAGGPLRMTLSGMNCVNGVVVSPDDSMALGHDDDSILWLWDLRSGTLRCSIETGRASWINCIARHPHRPIAVVARNEGGLVVVDMEFGVILHEVPSSEGVEDVAVSPDGAEIWTAHESGTVEARPLEGGERREIFVSWDGVTSIAPARGQRAFLAVRGTVQEWDLGRGEHLRTITDEEACVTSLVRSPSGRRLAAGWEDGRIDVWRLSDRSRLAISGHCDGDLRVKISGLAFAPDGRRLISGSWDGTVRVWDRSGRLKAVLRGHSMAVYDIAVLADGTRAVSASKDGTLRVWELKAKPALGPDFQHHAAVDALATHPDQGVLVSGGRDRVVAVWDLMTGSGLRHWKAHAGRKLHEGWVAAVSLAGDGDLVQSAGHDGTLRTWRLADGTPLSTVEGGWDSGAKLAMARDTPLLAVSTGDWGDVRLSFWRPGRDRVIGRIKLARRVAAVATSPDGVVTVAVDMDGALHVIDSRRRRVLWSSTPTKGRGWYSYGECVAVGPDAGRAIVGFPDGSVELWDLERRRKRRIFRLHRDRVWAVAISPDGMLGCSASWDRVLFVWRLETGEALAAYSSDDFWSCCMFPDNSGTVVAGDERGFLHFLHLENVPGAITPPSPR